MLPRGPFAQVGTSNGTSFDDTALTPGSTYYYRVRATNAVGDGAYSAEAQINTPSLPPTPIPRPYASGDE